MLPLKNRVIAAAFIIAGLSSEVSLAQSSKFLTLSEAVELCLQNNKQLKLNKVKVESATASTVEARERRLPDLAGSANYIRLTKPTIGGPLGNTASPNIDEAAYAMVSGSIPLFTGFRTKNGIESAKYLEEATKLDAENDKDAVIQNTVAAYSNLYKAQSTVSIVRENLKQAELRTADFTNLEKNGVIARNDLLRVQLQQSNVQLALMDAESNERLANLNMNIMLGLDDNTLLQLDSTSFVELNDARTFSEFEQVALMNRHDLAALKYREQSASAGIRMAKADYYPSLKLTGGYFAANIPNLFSISNAWNAGLGLSYNVASFWKTGAKVKSAKIRLAEVKASQDLMNDRVKMEVAQAFEGYILSKKKIEVYAQALEQATENNRITKNKYRNNLVTTTDLLDAFVQQLLANLDYANSKADAAVAYRRLLQTSGVANNEPKK
jgi:outer membrane protein